MKVNNLIPAIVHAAITASVKGIVKSALAGAEYLPKRKWQSAFSYRNGMRLIFAKCFK